MKLNVTDNDQITRILKAVTDDYGAVDVLINNAGITRDNILVRMKEEEWDDIINTNLSSVYRMSKAVLRGMLKKRSGTNYFNYFSGWCHGQCWTIKLRSGKGWYYGLYQVIGA